MAKDSPYKVSMKELDDVHVQPDDLVEGLDPTPPNPDAKGEEDREREHLLRSAGGA